MQLARFRENGSRTLQNERNDVTEKGLDKTAKIHGALRSDANALMGIAYLVRPSTEAHPVQWTRDISLKPSSCTGGLIVVPFLGLVAAPAEAAAAMPCPVGPYSPARPSFRRHRRGCRHMARQGATRIRRRGAAAKTKVPGGQRAGRKRSSARRGPLSLRRSRRESAATGGFVTLARRIAEDGKGPRGAYRQRPTTWSRCISYRRPTRGKFNGSSCESPPPVFLANGEKERRRGCAGGPGLRWGGRGFSTGGEQTTARRREAR